MKKGALVNVILLVLSILLCAGVKFAFHACAPKDDGSWMLCHWAEQVVFSVGAVFSLLSLARFFLKDSKIKAGISISFVPLSILVAFIPNTLIPLCMMKEMRCHTVMRPSVLVLCVLLAAVSVIDSIVLLKSEKKK